MSSKYLSVSTVAAGDTEYRVYWETQQMTGRLDITLELPIEDKAIAAELWALRHLLLVTEVTGINRTGDALELNVSHGAIRKLLMKKSSKKHLIPYTSWMSVRFSDAKITVRKQSLDITSIEAELDAAEQLAVTEASDPSDITVSPVIGQVKITQHAVKRYIERTGVSSSSRAWRSVLQLVKSNQLRDASLPEKIELQKRQKHQERARIMNAQNNWQLVFAPSEDGGGEPWTLVTVYQRPETHRVG